MDAIYAKVLAGVDPKDYYNTMIKYDRLNTLLREVQKSYNYYYGLSGKTIKQLSSMAMNNNFYRQQYILHWIAPPEIGFSFAFLDQRVVELSVTGTAEAWKAITASLAEKYLPPSQLAPQYGTLSKLLYDNKIEDLKKIQQTITQGLIQGLSNQKMGKSISETMDTNYWRGLRVARTESSRTMNQATQLAAIEAKNQGVDIKRIWIASLDDRTRSKHGAMDGKLAEVDQPFDNGVMGPGQWPTAGDNINERCMTGNVVVGADGEIIGPKARRGRNPRTGKNEVFEWKSYEKWADDNGLKENKWGEKIAA